MDKAACVALNSAARVCQGLIEETEETKVGAKFVIEKNGAIVGEWRSEVFLGETADFQVYSGDLDADGRDELIVANRNAISNGISISYWTIAILPFPANSDDLNPLRFQTEDFNVGATFVPRLRSGGFDIRTTEWQTLLMVNSTKKTALYFVGRWLAYQNGELVLLNRPISTRRYLSSFERQRLKSINDKNDVYYGLNSAATEKRRAEPLTDFFAKSETSGTIDSVKEKASSVDSALPDRIFVKTAAGESDFLFRSDYTKYSKRTFNYVGDYSQKRLYPKGYLPDLRGKRYKLASYAASENEPPTVRVLWLIN